jgi:hypothetical protein
MHIITLMTTTNLETIKKIELRDRASLAGRLAEAAYYQIQLGIPVSEAAAAFGLGHTERSALARMLGICK